MLGISWRESARRRVARRGTGPGNLRGTEQRTLHLREIFHTAHAYPDRIVELHFFRAELTGTPQPALGQELRWISREAFATLTFPPADVELIAGLIQMRF